MKYIDADKLKAEINGLDDVLNDPICQRDALGPDWVCGGKVMLKKIRSSIESLQQEQTETSSSLVDVDAVREDFMTEVYRVLDADPTNDRANAIIDAFDSLPTVQQQPERKPIWHNVAEEVPTEIGAEVVVACRNKNKECGIWLYDLIQCWEGEWKPRVNWEKPIRWAYVRDLDSERKDK